MIDLGQLTEATFDLKLTDGRVLNIRKPNKQLFNDTFKMVDLMEANEEEDKTLDLIYDFLTRIFNRNTNGIKLAQEDLEGQLDVVTAIYIIKAFADFITEAMQGVNF